MVGSGPSNKHLAQPALATRLRFVNTGTAPTPPRAPIAPPLPAKPAKSTAHPLLLTIPEVILRRFGADLRHPRPEAPPGLVFLRGGGSGQPGLCLIGFGAFGASSSRSFLPVSSTAGQPGRSVPGALHLRAACHRRFSQVSAKILAISGQKALPILGLVASWGREAGSCFVSCAPACSVAHRFPISSEGVRVLLVLCLPESFPESYFWPLRRWRRAPARWPRGRRS